MSDTSYDQILRETEKLSRTEQLLLVKRLVDRLCNEPVAVRAGRRWEHYAGVGAETRMEEDPQDWVSRTRRESDESRSIR